MPCASSIDSRSSAPGSPSAPLGRRIVARAEATPCAVRDGLPSSILGSLPGRRAQPRACQPGEMAVDPSVIAALEASVAAAPDNAALRLHLAGLLVEAGRASD